MNLLNNSQLSCKRLLSLLVISTILVTASCSNLNQTVELEVSSVLQQAIFQTPEQASKAFIQVMINNDEAQYQQLLGENFRQVLPMDEISRIDVENFIDAWKESHQLIPQGQKKNLIAVGDDDWTLPIPIIETTAGWHFDIKEGVERMRIRRIGRNELATMQAVLAYYDAQMEYAEQDHNGNHILEYAQKFISSPNSQDGLFWDAAIDEPLSPLGNLHADRTIDGGYHGYYYRILTAQGKEAQGGAYNYLINNQMRSGFAMIAWPEKYGETGVMSFIVNHEGIIYEQNLGANSEEIAKNMLTYNPDSSWIAVKEVSSSQDKIQLP